MERPDTRPILREARIEDVRFGRGVTLVQPVNLYGCTLGDEVFVGPFVEIQRRVSIGARSRIQSHSFVCELVEIGEDCFVGHGVMFVNDRLADGRPERDPAKWRPTRVGRGVSIGSNATILPVTICSGSVIGAGAVVTSDIEQPGVFAGNPARRLRDLTG